jgi:NTE family protein
MLKRFIIAALALLSSACATSPHEYPELARPIAAPIAPVQAKRPVVGLVLGAGGSRGFAHIGVIKVLEAAGIEPAVVVGSSSGAIVAALYAGGHRAAELEALALKVKNHELIDFTLFGPGRVEGEALQNFVNRELQNRSIEALARAFAVVATERAGRHMTIFTRGNAGLAVRASSSIPDVFWPVIIGGIEYVDGGLSSRVPVDVARRMGADVVIAVDVSWRGSAEAAAADVAIRPLNPPTKILDLSARIESIAAGVAAAKAALPEIQQRLALADAKLQAAAAKSGAPTVRQRNGRVHG